MFRRITLSASCLFLTISFAFAQLGAWEILSSSGTPTARHECSYVQAGNKFYLLGGRGNKPVQSYDPVANAWATETTSNPLELHHFQAVQYNGKVYVVCAFTGSCCHETPVSNIYIFDPATKTWSTGPQIPAGRRRGAAGCVVYNNKIYVACGITDGHSSGWVPWLDVFDPQTNTWTQLADAPRARDHFPATVANGKIYCIGGRRSGFNGSIFNYTTAEVDVYDIASNTWSTLPSSLNIPTQRAAPAAVLLGNEILVIGGEGPSVAYNVTEALNVITPGWRTLSPMNQSRHATSAVLYNNKVYIACGAGSRGGSNELNTQEVFNINSTPPPGCPQIEVVSFTLMKAGTAGEIGPLTEGMTINLATIGQFSIRANTCNNQTVGSVKFIVNGSTVKTENAAPYAINGDNGGSYIAWNPTVGSKTLTGTPYSGSNGSGSAGISETVNFTIINQTSGTPDCNGVPGGTAFIDDCGICSGGNTGHVANSDKDVCGVCFGNGSSCSGQCQPLQVTSLTLVREGTAGDIGPLTSGMTIYLATIGNFSIRANICPGSTVVKSVKFVLNGATVKTENYPPYAINGDSPTGSYIKWNVSPGNYTLTATPYSGANGSGTAGIGYTVNFTVSSSSAPKTDLTYNSSSVPNELLIYPNPGIGLFTIQMKKDTEASDLSIRIFNQRGQEVYSEISRQDDPIIQKQLSLKQPPGIYFVRLAAGNTVVNKKIIISKQ